MGYLQDRITYTDEQRRAVLSGVAHLDSNGNVCYCSGGAPEDGRDRPVPPVISPFVQRALTNQLPAKELKHG